MTAASARTNARTTSRHGRHAAVGPGTQQSTRSPTTSNAEADLGPLLRQERLSGERGGVKDHARQPPSTDPPMHTTIDIST